MKENEQSNFFRSNIQMLSNFQPITTLQMNFHFASFPSFFLKIFWLFVLVISLYKVLKTQQQQQQQQEISLTQQQHSVKLVMVLQQLLQVNLSSLVVDEIQQDQVIEWIFTM
jgi:hypothetical protein